MPTDVPTRNRPRAPQGATTALSSIVVADRRGACFASPPQSIEVLR